MQNKTVETANATASNLRQRTGHLNEPDKEKVTSTQDKVDSTKEQKAATKTLAANDTGQVSGSSRENSQMKLKEETASSSSRISKDLVENACKIGESQKTKINDIGNEIKPQKSKNDLEASKDVGSLPIKESSVKTGKRPPAVKKSPVQKVPEVGTPEWHDWMARLLSNVLSTDVVSRKLCAFVNK